MDLGHCPRCGTDWFIGDERCRACGYTAIGAGLSRLPKKKKKRVPKYVEPGGSGGFLSFTLVAVIFWGVTYYQPWQDDWDMVRALIGAPRHHSLKGKWEVLETLQTRDAKNNIYMRVEVSKGTMDYDGDQTVFLTAVNNNGEGQGTGTYRVDGDTVYISNIQKKGHPTLTIPKSLELHMAWNGPDDFVANIGGGDMLYVRRKKDPSLYDLLHFGVTKDMNDVPDNIRGMITSAKERAGGSND